MHSGPRKIGDGLWVIDGPFGFAGIQFGNRMTVMKSGGDLVLHSPLPFDTDLLASIQAFGTIKHLIAPNREHNLNIQVWKDQLPHATLWAPPGAKKLTADSLLVPGADIQLDGITAIPILGMPRLKEWVFVHRDSATLVITDLAFHFVNVPGFLSRLALKAYGSYGVFGPTHLIRFLIKDKAMFRQSLQQILRHPFDHVVMSHGDVITEQGSRRFKEAFQSYLD